MFFLITFLVTKAGKVEVDVISTNREVVLKITSPLVIQRKIEAKIKEEFMEVIIKGGGVQGEIGKPQLPVVREFIQIPEESEIVVDYKVGREEMIKLSSPYIPNSTPYSQGC